MVVLPPDEASQRTIRRSRVLSYALVVLAAVLASPPGRDVVEGSLPVLLMVVASVVNFALLILVRGVLLGAHRLRAYSAVLVGEALARIALVAALVLLDVDNGPGYLVHDANSALYGLTLLRTTRRAMRPGGLCVIWSAAHDQALQDAMAEVFGGAEATAYDVDLQGRAEQYWLHLAWVRSRA